MKNIFNFLKYASVLILVFLNQNNFLRSQTTEILTATVINQTESVSYNYLVSHGSLWHYRYGTNAPQSNWKTVADSGLDTSWMLGPAGFGYEDGDDVTILNNMSNRFTTLYIRRTFTIDSSIDAFAQLELVMDYDDAFIAWIDGVEVARSTNAPGSIGVEPSFNSVSSPPNHEALGYRGLPAEVYNLGIVGSVLQPGEHVLSIMGFNAAINSSDFSLIPDLRVATSANNAINGDLFSFVYTNKIILQGSNTVANSKKVTVNGLDATFNRTNGLWEISADLQPGVNRFFVAAIDDSGQLIKATNKYIVLIQNPTIIGGELLTNLTISGNGAITKITNTVIVQPSTTLTIERGSIILMDSSASIIVQSDGVLNVLGSEDLPVYFIPSDGQTAWGAIQSIGLNSKVYISNAVLVAGQIIGADGAIVEIYDSTFRDFRDPNRLFLTSTNAQEFIIKRAHISNYDQIRFFTTLVTIEDCLFEHIYSNACNFVDSNQISVKRTTYRFGYGSNTDAIDLGNTPNTILENLLIHHIPDIGVSIADFSHQVAVSNCLFYSNGIGISIYGSTNCILNQNTIVDNFCGVWLRQRYPAGGPGSATGINNIVWGNTTNILIADNSILELYYSDIQGDTVLSGEGNLNEDPIFNNPLIGSYKLKENSPLIGKGCDGSNIGITVIPGGIPAEPLNLVAYRTNSNNIILKWIDDSENETNYLIQISTNGINWTNFANVTENTSSFLFTNVVKDVRYYFRIRAENSSGKSDFSNIASALIQSLTIYYGGILTTNTVWTSESGTIIVSSNLIVPHNIMLAITPGATIKIAANTIIRATNGGTIFIEGAQDNPVKILPLDSTSTHREISAYGTNSFLTIRFSDFTGTQATVYQGASGLIEDSFFHDYNPSNSDTFTHPIVLTYFAAPTTIRRCHFKNYYEILLRNSVHLVEYSLFEYAVGDAMDFDAASPGTIVRHCTFRHGAVSNVDAIDIGNDGNRYSTFTTIESCIMHDFSYDKGVSIGDGSANIVVRNCLIYNCNSGIAVKDECTATIYNCTLISNTYGINLQAKYPAQYQGGRATNTYNNIIWDNQTQIFVTNNPIIVVNFSNIQGTNWPGTGNISQNPLFRNPSINDFRLMENSPCLGTGSNGVSMGVIYPVGGLPDIPANFRVSENNGNTIMLSWSPPTNYFSGYVLEKSVNGSEFTSIVALSPDKTGYADSSVSPGTIYSYRLKATNFIGSSFYTDAISLYISDNPIVIDTSRIRIQSGTFQISINGQPGKSYVLEVSENLHQWIPVQTNLPVNGIVELSDPEINKHQKRFYRISSRN